MRKKESKFFMQMFNTCMSTIVYAKDALSEGSGTR